MANRVWPRHEDSAPDQPPVRRTWIRREELMVRLREAQSDPGLRDELARLAGETTDDLGPIR
jgi:hypothetical protein